MTRSLSHYLLRDLISFSSLTPPLFRVLFHRIFKVSYDSVSPAYAEAGRIRWVATQCKILWISIFYCLDKPCLQRVCRKVVGERVFFSSQIAILFYSRSVLAALTWPKGSYAPDFVFSPSHFSRCFWLFLGEAWWRRGAPNYRSLKAQHAFRCETHFHRKIIISIVVPTNPKCQNKNKLVFSVWVCRFDILILILILKPRFWILNPHPLSASSSKKCSCPFKMSFPIVSSLMSSFFIFFGRNLRFSNDSVSQDNG